MEDGLGTWARHPVVVIWEAALTFASGEPRPSFFWLPQSSRFLRPQPPQTGVSGSPGTLLADMLGERVGKRLLPRYPLCCTMHERTGQAGKLGYPRQKSFQAGFCLCSWNSLPSCQ